MDARHSRTRTSRDTCSTPPLKAQNACLIGFCLTESWSFVMWGTYYKKVAAQRGACQRRHRHSTSRQVDHLYHSDPAAIMPPRKTRAPCQICKEKESKYTCPSSDCLID